MERIRMSTREDRDFLTVFEQQYGTFHPFIMNTRRFREVLNMSEDEHKLIFVYLHVLDHPSASTFCRQTLCCEPVVEFLDQNLVSWGAIVGNNNKRSGDGYHLASILKPNSFPFCAIISPESGDNLTVLQRIEGSVSPDEMVEILKRTMEEQLGPGFSNGRAKKGANTRGSTLKIDQEKAKLKKKNQHLPREKLKGDASISINSKHSAKMVVNLQAKTAGNRGKRLSLFTPSKAN